MSSKKNSMNRANHSRSTERSGVVEQAFGWARWIPAFEVESARFERKIIDTSPLTAQFTSFFPTNLSTCAVFAHCANLVRHRVRGAASHSRCFIANVVLCLPQTPCYRRRSPLLDKTFKHLLTFKRLTPKTPVSRQPQRPPLKSSSKQLAPTAAVFSRLGSEKRVWSPADSPYPLPPSVCHRSGFMVPSGYMAT